MRVIQLKEISDKESIFMIIDENVLKTLNPDQYMKFSYEEILVNLFNHICTDFGAGKAKAWFKKQAFIWNILSDEKFTQ